MYNEHEFNEYKHGADCDKPESSEFASDFIVETPQTTATEEFITTPTEYDVTSPESEQLATVDSDITNDYTETTDYSGDTQDIIDVTTDTVAPHNNYDTETSEELTDYETTDYETDKTNEFGYDVTESHDPSDETAATIDEWYTTDKPSARERCMLDDYEIISDVLGSEKQLVKLYSTALCEASEEPFRNVLRENLDNAAENQYKAFEFMQKRGMYPTEQASEQNITKAKQQFGSLTDCGCGSDPCGCTVNNNCGGDGCGFDK